MIALLRKHGWMVLAIVSILLNVFLVSIEVGRLLHGAERRITQALGQKVPPNLKQHLRSAIREHRQEIKGQWRKVLKVRNEVAQAIRAEPFQPERLKQALENLRQTQAEARKVFHMAMADVINELPADERELLADTWLNLPAIKEIRDELGNPANAPAMHGNPHHSQAPLDNRIAPGKHLRENESGIRPSDVPMQEQP